MDEEKRLYELDKSLFHILNSIVGVNNVNHMNFFNEKNRTHEERLYLIEKTTYFIIQKISGISNNDTIEYLQSRYFDFNEL